MNIQGCSEKSDNTEPIFVGKKDLQRAIQKAKLLTHVPKKKSTEKFRCSQLIIVSILFVPNLLNLFKRFSFGLRNPFPNKKQR